jgi:hypothetical protein
LTRSIQLVSGWYLALVWLVCWFLVAVWLVSGVSGAGLVSGVSGAGMLAVWLVSGLCFLLCAENKPKTAILLFRR